MSEQEVIEVIVLPEDELCEGCGEKLGEEVFVTDDMIVLCKSCWELDMMPEELKALLFEENGKDYIKAETCNVRIRKAYDLAKKAGAR